MIKSITAVFVGILLALAVGMLVVFGILWPVFEAFVDPQLAQQTGLFTVLLVFASAFAYYFGGMAAAYKAPSRRRLHGVLVGVLSFAISPIINLLAVGASNASARATDPFVNLRTPEALLFTGVLFVVVLVACYIGARRGETLYVHNEAVTRRYKRRKARESHSKEES